MGIWKSLTRREWVIVCGLCSVYFASSLCASLQAPFYPQEAEKKGASATEYGLVFGVYQLVAFITCPIFGKYVIKLGPIFLLTGGIITSGISSILFGLLTLVNSHAWFISLSILLRVLESLGAAAAVTAGFTIIVSVFKESVASMFAIGDAFFGLGFICGPIIGGCLFELGGFMAPFVLIGGLLLLDGVVVVCTISRIEDCNNMDQAKVKIFSVLKLPSIILNASAVIAINMSIGYIEALLEPHLRQFNLTPMVIGLLFVAGATTYFITAQLVGRLCDTEVNLRKFIVLGSLLVILGISLIGPAPFIPFDTTLSVVCIGLVIHGFASACLIIPSFIDAIKSASDAGFPDDITTYGIVSGIMTSAFYLGGFIGPSVAGFLYNAVGFEKGSLFIIAVHSALFVCSAWCVCTTPTPNRSLCVEVPSGGEKENLPSEEEILPLTITEAEEGRPRSQSNTEKQVIS